MGVLYSGGVKAKAVVHCMSVVLFWKEVPCVDLHGETMHLFLLWECNFLQVISLHDHALQPKFL